MFHRDKHEYSALLRETHPTHCTLTGNRRLVEKTSDKIFALSTHERGDFVKPSLNAGVFGQERLQQPLLHPKCGLVSDPKWGQTKMAFPFGVYEAKAWVGDYKECKKTGLRWCAQVSEHVGSTRIPGKSAESRRYQTEKS